VYDPNSEYTHGSYRQAVADPGTAPSDDPVVCLQVNASWIPYIIGSCLQLAQPTSWISGSPSLADLLGRVQDLLAIFGTAEACVAPQFRLTSGCGLQYSLDGGTTWEDFTDWATNFPLCVRADQARVVMQGGYDHPPIPEWNADGTDYRGLGTLADAEYHEHWDELAAFFSTAPDKLDKLV